MSEQSSGDDKPRISLTQFKNYETKLTKEKAKVKKQLYKHIRDECRSELDDYVFCSRSTLFPNYKCMDQYNLLQNCIKTYHSELVKPDTEHQTLSDKINKGDVKIPKVKWY